MVRQNFNSQLEWYLNFSSCLKKWPNPFLHTGPPGSEILSMWEDVDQESKSHVQSELGL